MPLHMIRVFTERIFPSRVLLIKSNFMLNSGFYKISTWIYLFITFLRMVNHVVKDDQKLFQCPTMVSGILIDMVEPCPDIVAFKRIVYIGLPLYPFFKNEWFIMGKLVITMIMTMINQVFVALWLHSWPWVWNVKTGPWNNHG